MFKNLKSGFSLVELSLVLIIVALIISAVISGKSLITNSKLTVLNSEMQTLKIAIGNYINDNGISTYTAKTTADAASGISLYDLMTDGYLEDESIYTGNSAATAFSIDNYYKSKVNGGGWIYAVANSNPGIQFGKPTTGETTATVTALLDNNVVNNFQKKYNKSGSIKITKVTGTGTSVLIVEFENGAQN